MKKLILFILLCVSVVPSLVFAQLSILRPSQGGTGIGTAVAGDINKCLSVSNNSPFTFTLASCGGSALPWPFTKQGDGYQATSTGILFTGGFVSNASTTIGANTNTTGLTILGGATTTGTFLHLGSTTLQVFSASAGTTTSATSTNLYTSNFLALGSTTLQNFFASRGTTTSATSTNLYTTDFLSIGSSTFQKLFAQSATATNLFSTNFLALASSTFQNFTGTNATTTQATTTNFAISNIISSLLKTSATGSIIPAILGTDYINSSEQNYKEAVKYATTAALPSNTYANGASGVGATITEAGVGALSVDGASPSIGDRILVKSESTQANNGIYTVTVAGSGIAAFVLTRATDFDQSSDIVTGDAMLVTAGTLLTNTTWAYLGIDSPTMGTSNITFTQVAGTGTGGSFAYPFLTLSTGEQATSTTLSFRNGFLSTASSTFTTGPLILASTTLQTFTGTNSTTTNATTTSLYATGILLAAGSVGTPSLAFDTSGGGRTGLYHSGGGVLSVSSGGSSVADFSSAGIGSKVAGSASVPSLYIVNDGFWRPSAGALAVSLGTGGTVGEVFRFGYGGKIGIGTTTPAWPLNIASSTAPQLTLTYGAGVDHWSFRNTGGILDIATSSNTSLATSTLSAFRLTTNGQPIFSFLSAAGCDVKSDSSGNLTCGVDSTAGSFAWPFTKQADGYHATSTGMLFSGGFLSTASTTVGNNTTATGLTIFGGATTTGQFLSLGSTTLQTFSAFQGTTTSATSTNLYSLSQFLALGSTTLQSFTATNATTTSATTTNFNVSANHLTVGTGNAFMGTTSLKSYTFMSSTTQDAALISLASGSTTNYLGPFKSTNAKMVSLGCQASTTGGVAGGFLLKVGPIGSYSETVFCDTNYREYTLSTNINVVGRKMITGVMSKASSTPASGTYSIFYLETSE